MVTAHLQAEPYTTLCSTGSTSPLVRCTGVNWQNGMKLLLQPAQVAARTRQQRQVLHKLVYHAGPSAARKGELYSNMKTEGRDSAARQFWRVACSIAGTWVPVFDGTLHPQVESGMISSQRA